MLDKMNGVTDKPGFMAGVLGLLGLGISFLAGKFSQRDMRNVINDAAAKNNLDLKGGK